MFLQRPFIIVGARLADEFDLAEFLRRGSSAKQLMGRPAVIVLRQISELNKRQFRKWGLVPVEAEAEQFFSLLKAEIQAVEASIAGLLPGPTTTQLVPQAITFLKQFAWLRADDKPIVPPGHDFYLGHDPLWSDILADNDAYFQGPSRCAEHVPEGETLPARQEVHCLWGGPGSGKTTALLRIARILIGGGADAFLFRGEERLDRAAAMWWLQRSPRSVLLFDGLGDVAEELGRLTADCAAAKVPISVVSTERRRRIPELYENFPPDVFASWGRSRTGDAY